MAAGMPRQRLIESWYPDGELLTASPGRRLGGELLDAAIQFVCVFGGGLAVGPRDVVYRREAGTAPPMPPCGRA